MTDIALRILFAIPALVLFSALCGCVLGAVIRMADDAGEDDGEGFHEQLSRTDQDQPSC